MNDTVRIERPLCCRRREDLGGRIKRDSLGNTLKVKTRACDSEDDFAHSLLEQTVDLESGSAHYREGAFCDTSSSLSPSTRRTAT